MIKILLCFCELGNVEDKMNYTFRTDMHRKKTGESQRKLKRRTAQKHERKNLWFENQLSSGKDNWKSKIEQFELEPSA